MEIEQVPKLTMFDADVIYVLPPFVPHCDTCRIRADTNKIENMGFPNTRMRRVPVRQCFLKGVIPDALTV